MADDRPSKPLKEPQGGPEPRWQGGSGQSPSQDFKLPEGALELEPVPEEAEPPLVERVTRPPLGGGLQGLGGPGAPLAGGPPSFRDAAPLELDHSMGPPRGVAAGASSQSPVGEPPGPGAAQMESPNSARQVAPRRDVAAAPAREDPAAAREEEARAGRRRMLILGGGLAGAAALAGLYYGMGWHKERQPTRRRSREAAEPEDDAPGQPDRRPVLPPDIQKQEVQILFDVTPKDALLLVRGKEAIDHSLLMPWGDQPIEVRFEAKGHRPEVVKVVPDKSKTVVVRLTPSK
ncbi:MAG: hypothetical protein RBU30_03575 [Polyangia bacterium]|nr:hypothetical protein [Polyangia bacterium]